MKISLQEIPIADVFDGYVNNEEAGVIGYGGKLNIRPPYQREFVYRDKQRDEVINTVTRNFPLNVMYWVKGTDGYELMDGQQRTLSICQYVSGDFSFKSRYFHNLTEAEKQQILDYKLMVYICEGSDKEKLDWFQIINIAGEELTPQELRNAIYAGPWTTAVKKYFSKTQCPAYQIGDKYVSGKPIRQEYLEKVLEWLVDKEGLGSIEDYMALHQHDQHANKEWLYFQSVINWVKATFPVVRSEMKGVNWGWLYNRYGQNAYDSKELEAKIKELMEDDDVTKKSGIYQYLLTGEERYLSIRAFPDKIKKKVYAKQEGKCRICKKSFDYNAMQGDHIVPWSKGGHTVEENCQMLCRLCNASKSDK